MSLYEYIDYVVFTPELKQQHYILTGTYIWCLIGLLAKGYIPYECEWKGFCTHLLRGGSELANSFGRTPMKINKQVMGGDVAI